MEHTNIIHDIAHAHPRLAIALIVISLITAEIAAMTSLPDWLILIGRLVSYGLAGWGSIELGRYYRAKRKNLKDGHNN